MGHKIINVKPESITVPKGVYPRRRPPVETDVQHLRGLNADWHNKVVTANGGKILVDGAHRILAAQLDGIKSIEVLDLGKCTEDEVLREAISRNSTHGKQLTMAEKQDMAAKLVGDMTAGALCALLGVSDRTMSRWLADAKDTFKVNAIAKARKLLEEGESMTAVAKEIGVARGTLQGWLKADSENPTEPPSTGSKSSGSKGTQTRGSSGGSQQPETEMISRSDLLKETRDLIDMTATGIVGECKAAVKGENPDGLHWADFARLVTEAIEKQFPKSAKKAA
jgi:transposase-like protein